MCQIKPDILRMKYFLILFYFLIPSFLVRAQGFDIKLSAGANSTYMRNFDGNYTIETGELGVTPSLNQLPSHTTQGFGNVHSVANYKVGAFADAEFGIEFWNKWRLSFSLGGNQITYTYDTKIPANNWTGKDTSVKAMIPSYGDTRLLYLSSRFANLSKSFGKISLQAGPVLHYLLHKKYENSFYFRDTANMTYSNFKEERGAANHFLIGGNLNLRYTLIRELEVMVGTQYFFSKLYDKEGTAKDQYQKSNPLQLQVGLSYRIAYF